MNNELLILTIIFYLLKFIMEYILANIFQYLARQCTEKGYKLDKQVHCETDKCNGDGDVVITKTEQDFKIPKMFKHGFK